VAATNSNKVSELQPAIFFFCVSFAGGERVFGER